MEAQQEDTDSTHNGTAPENPETKPQDRWRFVVPVFLLNMLMAATRFMFPLLYIEFIEYFDTNVADAGWIGSIQIGGTYFFGIVFSGPVKIYGCRAVAFAGSLVVAVGYALSFFAPNLLVLCLTYGLIPGIGLSMCSLSCATLIQQRFHKNRTFATAVSMMAIGVGNIIGPMWTTFLLRSYGWRGTLLIHGGVTLNGCVIAMFMRTPKMYRFKEPETNEKTGCLRAYFRDLTDFSALKDLAFALMCLSGTLSKFTMTGSVRHLANRALVDGFSQTRAAALVSIYSAGILAARLPAGKLADSKRVNRVLLVGVVLIISGMFLVGFCLPENYVGYVILCGAFGTTIGCTNLVEVIIQVDLLGVERIARTQAISNAFQGVSVLISVPVAGWLYDITGNYDIPYIVNGCIRVISGICVLLILLVRRPSPALDMTSVGLELEEPPSTGENKQTNIEET